MTMSANWETICCFPVALDLFLPDDALAPALVAGLFDHRRHHIDQPPVACRRKSRPVLGTIRAAKLNHDQSNNQLW